MRCIGKLILAGLMGLFVTGCDPFETEITINPDGSGKMVQRGQISPAACMGLMMSEESRDRSAQFILSEGEAKAWGEAHPDGPVKLVSFSCKRDDNGWWRLSCEVTFTDLAQFAATEWGWPLGLSASARDGRTELRFSDPVRGIWAPMAQGEMTAEDGDETAAMLQIGSSLAAGLRTRVTWKLPVEALGAEGAQLSADKKAVAYETTIGEGVDKFRAWLEDKTAPSILLPAGGPVKPFARPQVPVVPGKAVAQKPLAPETLPPDAKDFEFRLASVSLDRSIRYDLRHPGGKPVRNDVINVRFSLLGPEGAKFQPTDRSRAGETDEWLSALKDGDGNDLRGPDTKMSFMLTAISWKLLNTDKAQYDGNFCVSLKPPASGSQVLALIEGYLLADRTLEAANLELKPLKDNLEKDFALPSGVLRFTSFAPDRVVYLFTPKVFKGIEADNPFTIGWRGPDDQPVFGPPEGGKSVQDKKIRCVSRFYRPLPEGAYPVVTYPVKVEKVKLPFKVENLQLP